MVNIMIYLDNAATTKVYEEAVEAIISYISGREYPDADEMAEFIEGFTVESQINKIERQLCSS